jgi:phosphoglycerate dehydrogenase-like enzyme
MQVLTFTPFTNPFWSLPEQYLRNLQEQFPQIEFRRAESPEDLAAQLPETEIFFGFRLSKEHLQAAKNLKWIHVAAANVFGFDTDVLEKKNILLTNSRGLHAVPIAEHVLGCMLVFSRRFMDCWRFQEARHYGQTDMLNHPPPLLELRGKTVVVLGLGQIGKEVAKLCRAIGMRVVGVKRQVSNDHPGITDELFGYRDLHLALPQADFLVISAARTSETEGLIGENELSMLKTQCVIINIARAQIIQEQPFMTFLKEGRIRGAALDVFYQEPLPADSPLYAMSNVFVTPHVSGVASEFHWPRMIELFSENLRRYLLHQPLLNMVDLHAGY